MFPCILMFLLNCTVGNVIVDRIKFSVTQHHPFAHYYFPSGNKYRCSGHLPLGRQHAGHIAGNPSIDSLPIPVLVFHSLKCQTWYSLHLSRTRLIGNIALFPLLLHFASKTTPIVCNPRNHLETHGGHNYHLWHRLLSNRKGETRSHRLDQTRSLHLQLNSPAF